MTSPSEWSDEELVARALEILNDEILEETWSRAASYFDGTLEFVESLQTYFEKYGRLTPKQRAALVNAVEGLERWLEKQ
jgi:predicted DNA binding protein